MSNNLNNKTYDTKNLCVVRMHYLSKKSPLDPVGRPVNDLTLLAIDNHDGTFTLVSSGDYVRSENFYMLNKEPENTVFALIDTEKTEALINENQPQITHNDVQKYEANLNPHKNPDNLFVITAKDGSAIVVYKEGNNLIYKPSNPAFKPFMAFLNKDGMYALSTGGTVNPLQLEKLTDKYPDITKFDGDNPYMVNPKTLAEIENELMDLGYKQSPPASEAVVDASTTKTDKKEQDNQNKYQSSEEQFEHDYEHKLGGLYSKRDGHDANMDDELTR